MYFAITIVTTIVAWPQLFVGLYFAITIVGSCLGCCCNGVCGVPVALEGKDVMVTKMLIEDMLMLLMLTKDCKQANTTS